jgi:hypothetical protein
LKPFEKTKKAPTEKRVENIIDEDVQRIPSSSQNTGSQNYTQSKEYTQNTNNTYNFHVKDLKDMTHSMANNSHNLGVGKAKANPSSVNFQINNYSKTNRKPGGMIKI